VESGTNFGTKFSCRPKEAIVCFAVVLLCETGPMPRISSFFGIVIEMYFGDHPPPHFHARYSGESAKIEIATGDVLAGSLSNRALRLVREWVEQHRDELEANWERAVNNDKPEPIEPLQ
jgi:uncharacterized protein DUF4160